MANVRSLLAQPYPYYYEGRQLFSAAFIVFVIGVVFLFLFQPFSNYYPEHRASYFVICAAHALVAATLFVVWSLTISKTAATENWTLGKEVVFFVVLLLLIGTGQFLIRDIIYDNPNNWSWKFFWEELWHTFLIGGLFLVIWVPTSFRRAYQENVDKASLIGMLVSQKGPSARDHEISIKTKLKSDDFTLTLSSFLYARSEGNYVEVFLNNVNGWEKQTKRVTLTDFSQQVAAFTHLFRTHRSYLVNLEQIELVTGNAQGYKLRLKGHPHAVPVARNSIKAFEAALGTS